jgi:hypothetical protein
VIIKIRHLRWEVLEKLSPAKGDERYVLEIYGRQYRSTDPNFDIVMDAAADGIRPMAKS